MKKQTGQNKPAGSKRAARILGVSLMIVVSLSVILVLSTNFVDTTPFYNADYYKRTLARIDSLDKYEVTVYNSVRAGFSGVSITPGLDYDNDCPVEGNFTEVPLAGYGARKGRPAEGIHDSIYVTAAAVDVGGRTVILVTADLLIMPPNIIDSVATLLKEHGIEREQLFFSATHTHSSLGGWGPGIIGRQFSGRENRNIQKWLAAKISEAVTGAVNDLRPARIGSGSFSAGELTRNRLIGERGTKYGEFSFIVLEQTGGRKAVIGSFPAHTTTLGAGNMEISGDYPGYWARKMKSGSFDYALFFAGAMGSQSPVGEGREFERAEYIGVSLADKLFENLPGVTLEDTAELSFISLKVDLPPYRMRLTGKLTFSTYISRKLMPEPENTYLQALRMGNLVWVTTPADFSGEYALNIRNSLAVEGFNANITSFNGCYTGYIIPGRYFHLKHYESRTMGWFGPSMGPYTMDLIRIITGIVTRS